MEALEAKTSQMYHPPSLNDLVYNFMRDQHMMVRVRVGNTHLFSDRKKLNLKFEIHFSEISCK